MNYEYVYSLALGFSLVGLFGVDVRFKRVFFSLSHRPLTSIATTVVAVVFFMLLWDYLGVKLGIFSTNQSLVLGLHLGNPDLPIEEVLFLTLCTYLSLILQGGRR